MAIFRVLKDEKDIRYILSDKFLDSTERFGSSHKGVKLSEPYTVGALHHATDIKKVCKPKCFTLSQTWRGLLVYISDTDMIFGMYSYICHLLRGWPVQCCSNWMIWYRMAQHCMLKTKNVSQCLSILSISLHFIKIMANKIGELWDFAVFMPMRSPQRGALILADNHSMVMSYKRTIHKH